MDPLVEKTGLKPVAEAGAVRSPLEMLQYAGELTIQCILLSRKKKNA
ncbi:hypothetical protein HQ563_02900 [bacterium]|nr:hypothetical protein [bacterium]